VRAQPVCPGNFWAADLPDIASGKLIVHLRSEIVVMYGALVISKRGEILRRLQTIEVMFRTDLGRTLSIWESPVFESKFT